MKTLTIYRDAKEAFNDASNKEKAIIQIRNILILNYYDSFSERLQYELKLKDSSELSVDIKASNNTFSPIFELKTPNNLIKLEDGKIINSAELTLKKALHLWEQEFRIDNVVKYAYDCLEFGTWAKVDNKIVYYYCSADLISDLIL